MKKNFGISIGTIITVMLLVVTVYANTHVDTNDKISESEMNMITLATDEKNMLKYFASTEDTLVQTVNLSSENNVKYNYDKAIKCYSIFDIDKDKILDEIDEYNVVIPIEKK